MPYINQSMKRRTIPFLILLFLASLPYPHFKAARAGDHDPVPADLTILGLDINDCTSVDIYSRLGPTIPIREGTNRLCYVSDRDDTLLLFSTRGSRCIGFKMVLQKKRFNKWHFCEKSPLVSTRMATDNGIKLGMTKGRLKTILGLPQEEAGQKLIYVTPGRVKITAEFTDNGLILFDLSKIRQY